MGHDNHVIDGINKDLSVYTREDYLAMTSDHADMFNPPIVQQHNGYHVVRDDHIIGAKARFGQWLFNTIQQAYRVVHASIETSIDASSDLC